MPFLKTLLIATVSAVLGVHVRAQLSLPPCAINCLQSAVSNDGCPSTDFQCHCSSASEFVAEIETCVSAECTTGPDLGLGNVFNMMCASLSGISVSAPPAAEATPLETTTSMTTPAFSTTASETTEATSVRSLATSSSGVSVVSTSSSSSSMTSSRIQLASSVAVSVSSSEAVQTSSSSSSSSGSSSSVTGSVITIPVPVITRVVQQSISEGQPTLTSSVIGYSIETTSGTTSIATPSSSNSQIVKFTIFANDVAPPQSTSTSSLVFNLTGGGIIVVSNLTNISISTPSVTQPITTGGVAGGLLDRSMENSVGLHILLALLITFI